MIPKRLRNHPISDGGGKVIAVDVFIEPDGKVWFIAKHTIDADGSGGNPYNDPYFQPDTAYHHNGRALNPYTVPFIVVPPQLITAVRPIVLGCRARATNISTKVSTKAIVGDIGPKQKIGEGSCRCAELIGLSPHPNHGGTLDYNAILWEFWPGQQETIDGITYNLQAS